MPALRDVTESLGHGDVETYSQSGNVVFAPAKGSPADLGAQLEQAITDATGLDVAVVVRTGKELAGIVESNPYATDDPTKVVVAFLGEAVEPAQLGLGDLVSYLPDELTARGRGSSSASRTARQARSSWSRSRSVVSRRPSRYGTGGRSRRSPR